MHQIGERSSKRRLVIGPEATWFRVGDGSLVMLENRKPLRKRLLALAHLPHGVKMPVVSAFEAGWPGDRALPKAAATRVYTAVHVLKRLGLEDVLVRHESGYFLDAIVEIVDTSQTLLPDVPSTTDLDLVSAG